MGTIIRGDVIESTDVLVPTTEQPKKPKAEDDKGAVSADGKPEDEVVATVGRWDDR